MKTRRNRSRRYEQKSTPSSNGKLFVQIVLCIAIICTFMLFKDASLPGGKTPRDYARQILNTTVNIPEITARFFDDLSLPASVETQVPKE